MREVSVTDLERAFQDLYKAIRLSTWDFIYDIDGTAEGIANAVAELAEKRIGVQKAVTNADRIRSMTDEELLKFIQMVYGNGRAGLSPTNGFEEWLNKPNSLDEMEDGHYYIMKDGILYKAKVATPEEMGAKTFNIKEYIENGDK